MKKALFLLLFVTTSTFYAQSNFGIKAGLNYADNGEIEFADVQRAQDTDRKAGYHFGVYYRYEIAGIFIRPELLYTETKSSISYQNSSSNYDISKLDLPVLVGLDLLGPINVFAGPSFQYILDNDLEGFSIEDVDKKFTVGAQFGVGVQLGPLGVDLRYERALSENQADLLDLNNPAGIRRIDTRPDQFIVSLSLDL